MENIERYKAEIRNYISLNPDVDEDELVRNVFYDLALKLSFDLNYTPFGSSKRKQEMYRISSSPLTADACLESKEIICRSGAKIAELVLKDFVTSIETVADPTDKRRCPHVYNIVETKSGRYIIDLQEDMYRVKMHARTLNYGISPTIGKYVISLFKQEQMDLKLGLITPYNYYTDEYLYMLKNDVSCMDTVYEKAKFILENIDSYENSDINYTDRLWYHRRVLEFFFDMFTFDPDTDRGQIKLVTCYKEVDGKRICYNTVTVEDGTSHVFIYNKKEFRYREIDLENFANAYQKGLVVYNARIPGVDKILRKRKENR